MKPNPTLPTQFKTTIPRLLIAISLLLAWVAFSPMARALGPAPDAGTVVTDARQIEGTWRSTITINDGPPPFSALNSINGGGTYSETDETQLTVPAGGSSAGVWTIVGKHQYAFTWETFLFDLSADMPAGKFKLVGVITLIDRNHYTAEDHFTFYDVDGNPTADGCATEDATRMAVEPLIPCPAGSSQSATYPSRGLKPAKGWKSLLP